MSTAATAPAPRSRAWAGRASAATACRLCGWWCTRPESESDSGSEAGLVLSVRDVCSRGSHFKPLVGLPGDISLMRSSCSERCDAVWSRPCGRSHAWISLVRCDLIFILSERLLLWMLFFLPLLLSHSPSEQASKACQFQFSIYPKCSGTAIETIQVRPADHQHAASITQSSSNRFRNLLKE